MRIVSLVSCSPSITSATVPTQSPESLNGQFIALSTLLPEVLIHTQNRLIFIYFGLDGTGIDKSPKFDPVIGPILFISFAALSNTLLTAVLVAILSTTYSKIAQDAVRLLLFAYLFTCLHADADSQCAQDAENMFRKAVMTLEGVKSDSLFDCELSFR